MRYRVLATDYDGTIAHHGRVNDELIAALERLLATGRKLVMVTGRELPELMDIFPHTNLFDWIVAENGALLYRPATKEERVLGQAPSEQFLDLLRWRGVQPLSAGRSIVATFEPHENTVLEAIRDLGIEWQVIFNKGAVMALPSGVNKATGLTAALAAMGLSPHNAVGVGDAENDHAFLSMCEVSAAVANALPAVKETADFVTTGDHGAGVAQLVDAIVASDLAELNDRLPRRRIKFGYDDAGEVTLPAHGRTILVCGPSASGKSTLVTRLVESLAEEHYQFCLMDPEGDYENLESAVVVGGPEHEPVADDVLHLLKDPLNSVVVNLTGKAIADRPPFFLKLLTRLLGMRSSMGRPHWLVLDEAHHLLPAQWRPPDGILPDELASLVMITVHPELLASSLLERVTMLLAVGDNLNETVSQFCAAAGAEAPELPSRLLESGEALLWRLGETAQLVRVHPPKTERRRHRRKYAEGELPPDRSFFFRGPEQKLNLRAQNLTLFLQVADGVDDETWEFHRRQGDYSRWFRDCIKDEALTAAAEQLEGIDEVAPEDGRAMLRAAVERDYVVAAPSALPTPGAS